MIRPENDPHGYRFRIPGNPYVTDRLAGYGSDVGHWSQALTGSVLALTREQRAANLLAAYHIGGVIRGDERAAIAAELRQLLDIPGIVEDQSIDVPPADDGGPGPAVEPVEKRGRHFETTPGICACGWDALEWFPPRSRPDAPEDVRARRIFDTHCRNANFNEAKDQK